MITQTVVEIHWRNEKRPVEKLVVNQVQPAPAGVVLNFQDGDQRKIRFIPLDTMLYFDSWKDEIPEGGAD